MNSLGDKVTCLASKTIGVMSCLQLIT